MSARTCPLGKCDGSGYESVCVEPGAGLSGFETWPCDCAKRKPAPQPSERDKCSAWGCIGCAACVPGGYIP